MQVQLRASPSGIDDRFSLNIPGKVLEAIKCSGGFFVYDGFRSSGDMVYEAVL